MTNKKDKYDIKLNIDPPSDEAINKHKDFHRLMRHHKVKKRRGYRELHNSSRRLIYILIMMIALITAWLLLKSWNKDQSSTESQPSYLAYETIEKEKKKTKEDVTSRELHVLKIK